MFGFVLRWRGIALLTTGLLLGGTSVGLVSAEVPAVAAATTHQLTIVGIDFHPLDGDTILHFAPGTGGGVFVRTYQVLPVYIEAPLELPTAALVTKVTFFVRYCGAFAQPNKPYFGAYTPATADWSGYIPEFAPRLQRDCSATQAVAKTLSTAVTVRADQRFVVGWHVFSAYSDASIAENVLIGARVTYVK